jgi:hypothetical protein
MENNKWLESAANELVPLAMGCPKCGNRIMDDLMCTDVDTVICQHCQTEYDTCD